MSDRCSVASVGDCPPDRNAMPGTAGGTWRRSTRTVASATACGGARFAAFLPAITMLGFSTMPSSITRCSNSCRKTLASTASVTCSQRRIARQRMRVRLDGERGGNALGNIDDCAPFGEARAEPAVVAEPLAQAVESLGDGLAVETRERLRTQVHLDTGDDALLHQVLRKRRTLPGLLADGLVVQDDAADRLGGAWRREQHLAIGAAMLLGRLQLDAIEALLDGAAALVRGQNTLASGDHCAGNAHQLTRVHRRILHCPRRAPDGRAGRAAQPTSITTPGKSGRQGYQISPPADRTPAALTPRCRVLFGCQGPRLVPSVISTKLVLVYGVHSHAAYEPAYRLRHRAACGARGRAGARADRGLARRADAHRSPYGVQASQAAAARGAGDLDPRPARRLSALAPGGANQRGGHNRCPRGSGGAHRLLRGTR